MTTHSTCPICIEQLNDNVIELQCGNNHCYHVECIEKALKHNFTKNPTHIPKCPLCRNYYNTYKQKNCLMNINNLINEGNVKNDCNINNEYDVEDDDLSLYNQEQLKMQINNLSKYLYLYSNNYRMKIAIEREIQKMRNYLH